MAKFNIFKVNPFTYKNEIISLWKYSLSDTPPGRLEWMDNNPEGSAIWYVAIDEKSQTVAGSISVMPRRIKLRDDTYLSGIVGDLMVGKKYQVFGPALQLVKAVVKDHSRLGFSFLYTFPNQAAEKLVLRAGFEKIATTKRFTKLLKLDNYLNKCLHPSFVRLVSKPLNFTLKVFSKETYMKTDIISDEIAEPKALPELFWAGIDNQWLTMGERSPNYIKWRYFQNPLYKFNVHIFRQFSGGPVLGQIVFTAGNNRVHVFDMLSTNRQVFASILAQFLRDMRKNGYDSISVRVIQDSPLTEDLNNFGFSDRNNAVSLLFAGNSKFLPTKWLFLDGDRNV